MTRHALSLHEVHLPQTVWSGLRPSVKKGKGTRNHGMVVAAVRVAELPVLVSASLKLTLSWHIHMLVVRSDSDVAVALGPEGVLVVKEWATVTA